MHFWAAAFIKGTSIGTLRLIALRRATPFTIAPGIRTANRTSRRTTIASRGSRVSTRRAAS
jgi:hypothetical protein